MTTANSSRFQGDSLIGCLAGGVNRPPDREEGSRSSPSRSGCFAVNCGSPGQFVITYSIVTYKQIEKTGSSTGKASATRRVLKCVLVCRDNFIRMISADDHPEPVFSRRTDCEFET